MATKDLITEKETNNFSELGEAERGDRIEKLETERDDLIFKLELLMERSAKLLRRRSLAKRKYKLGSSPNDRKS